MSREEGTIRTEEGGAEEGHWRWLSASVTRLHGVCYRQVASRTHEGDGRLVGDGIATSCLGYANACPCTCSVVRRAVCRESRGCAVAASCPQTKGTVACLVAGALSDSAFRRRARGSHGFHDTWHDARLIWLRDQAEERLRTRRAIYQTETEESVLQHSWSYILLTTVTK